ncbi:type 1 fimbrial protein [Xenorhabdus sp. DI]|uniref:fimbrial protein n=1 Tax=Xenorhabdus doucetiae TaxID=351671 RepID=UPI0019A125D6|nr:MULTISPECIES: fimbrial protein [unclassified Xenorhabdus]MBD2786171.1 type 1 fimbrial protein [Xenorhabdus sp. 3]MBD2789534.1 type 1 fimbrial protein [Xenorhabdus sp. DI]
MKLLIKSMTIVAIWGVMAVSAFAMNNTGNIKFSGKVTKGTCSTAVASGNGNVNMPDVGVGDFKNVGDAKGDTDFDILLSKCSVQSKNSSSVKVKFTGSADGDNAKVLKNIAADTPAAGVGIGIYKKKDNSLIQIGNASVEVDTLTSGDTTKSLKFIAKYVATKTPANITSGPVQAYAGFTVEYN